MGDRRGMGEGNGAGCGPRDGRRVKHEGAKARSDDAVIHRLHRLHRLNDDDFLPQGARRTTMVFYHPDRHRDKLRTEGTRRMDGGIHPDGLRDKRLTQITLIK